MHEGDVGRGRRLGRLRCRVDVLKDSDRFKIYREHGYEGLVKSRAVRGVRCVRFGGFTMYESFFAGEDEEDRQTWCSVDPEIGSPASASSEDENDDVERDDATEIDPDDEILMTSENSESLKNAPRKLSAVNDAADDDFPGKLRPFGVDGRHRDRSFAGRRCWPSTPRASRDRSNDAKNDNNDIDDIYA